MRKLTPIHGEILLTRGGERVCGGQEDRLALAGSLHLVLSMRAILNIGLSISLSHRCHQTAPALRRLPTLTSVVRGVDKMMIGAQRFGGWSLGSTLRGYTGPTSTGCHFPESRLFIPNPKTWRKVLQQQWLAERRRRNTNNINSRDGSCFDMGLNTVTTICFLTTHWRKTFEALPRVCLTSEQGD